MLMVELFLLVLGVIGYAKIGVDLYPDVEPPVVTITTRYPGAGPQEIETLVSKPIEEEVNQIGGIERLMSTSRDGVSQVVVEFRLDVDIKRAQIEVRDKLSRVRPDLPRDIEEPLIQRLDYADAPILQIAVIPDSDRPLEQREQLRMRLLADSKLKPVFQQVDGVGQVDLFGGLEREIHVDLDRQKLLLWRLTPASVAKAVELSNRNVPGGEIREEPRSRSLRLMGDIVEPKQLEQTIISQLPGGRVVRVGDVGTVVDSFKDLETSARVNGKSVVLLSVKKQSGTNTVQVANAVVGRIAEAKALLPKGYGLEAVYDGSRVIRMSLHDVQETLIIAAILAVIVVYFFLGSLQSTFITGLALPTTIIATFFALFAVGFTLNIMTLLGLTLAVGLLLDDAIVVRENIWSKIEQGMEPRKASMVGSQEVVIAVIATSLTIIATFLPVTLIPGMVGRFFTSFAFTVCIAVAFSLFDALTMAPMLSAHLVRHGMEHAKPNAALRLFEKYWAVFARYYEKLLQYSLAKPKRILGVSLALFVFSIGLLRFVGFTFLPESENGEVDIAFEAPAGTTLSKTDLLTREIENTVKSYTEVDRYVTRLGNEFGDENVGMVYVKLKPFAQRQYTTSQMKTKWRKDFAGLAKKERLALNIRDAGSAAGGRDVSVAVKGEDTAELARISAAVMETAPTKIPEIVNLDSSLKPGRGEIQFQVDRRRASEFGLSTDGIGEMIRGLFEGLVAGQFREKGEEFDIRVRLKQSDRLGTSVLSGLTIPNSRGEETPLRAVMSPVEGVGPTKIIRIDLQRALMLEGDLAQGAPLATAMSKLTGYLETVLPAGYSLSLQGRAKSLGDLKVGAMLALVLGGLFIYMIMASLYESFILPFSILLTLPLAIVGAVAALLITGKLMDIYSVIGIILLMGLVTKNAILLVDYVEHLRRDGMDWQQALAEAGRRRLRPIMMTTVAMIAGMLPIAIGYGELNKARAGMGIASIGGMVSSTLLSLVVVPCAYIYLEKLRVWSSKWVHWYRTGGRQVEC